MLRLEEQCAYTEMGTRIPRETDSERERERQSEEKRERERERLRGFAHATDLRSLACYVLDVEFSSRSVLETLTVGLLDGLIGWLVDRFINRIEKHN